MHCRVFSIHAAAHYMPGAAPSLMTPDQNLQTMGGGQNGSVENSCLTANVVLLGSSGGRALISFGSMTFSHPSTDPLHSINCLLS